MEQTIRAIVCTACNVQMTEHRQASSKIQYFLCGGCHRWVSSTYAEVLRSDTFREVDPEAEAERTKQFRAVKDRLERFLAGLDVEDPYRVLGVAPGASMDEVRSRYREAALEHHPDRGGSVQKMAELNLAFERITGHRQRHQRTALPARGTPTSGWPRAQAATAQVSAPAKRRYAVPVAVLDRA